MLGRVKMHLFTILFLFSLVAPVFFMLGDGSIDGG